MLEKVMKFWGSRCRMFLNYRQKNGRLDRGKVKVVKPTSLVNGEQSLPSFDLFTQLAAKKRVFFSVQIAVKYMYSGKLKLEE